jgi:hypothetical protein
MSETYEQLRDSASGEAGEAWKRADREEANLRTFYRELKDDPRYTEEHKAEKAWTAYEATKEKIAADKAKAREGLEKQARTGEYFSFPMPEGEPLIPSDTSKLLASQNESSRLIRKLDRMTGSGGPFKPDRAEVLKQEYEHGLQIGGVHGGAVCRGVLEAADELGLDRHQIVDSFRKQSHRNALEDTERAVMRSGLIGKQIQEPPFKRPSSSPGRTSGGGKFLIPRERSTPIQSKRRSSWR